MSAMAGGRIVRLFSAAVVDQVVLSGTNFLVGFILIRFTSDKDYALYVLVQSALLLLTTAHNAWLAGPVIIMAPKKSAPERRELVSSVKVSQRRFLRRAVWPLLLVPLLVFTCRLCSAQVALVMAVAIIAGWAALRRELVRMILLIYSRPHSLLFADTAYALALMMGVTLAVLSVKTAILGVTATLVIAAWLGAAVAHRSLASNPGWGSGDTAVDWPALRAMGLWSLVGSVIYWFFSQGYNYVLATRLDLKAVADVNAARLLLMPAIVLTIGLQGLLTPTAANWYAEVGLRRLVRRLLLIIVGVGFLDLMYFTFVWVFRDWLIGDLLHKHIGDRDRLLVLWALVAIIGLMRDVLQCALFALGRLKSMAGQIGLSTAIAFALMWFGLGWWGPAAALIGQIVGEVVNLAGIIGLLLQRSRPRVNR
jgi:O-antigen/teichoic acid export membrane protein